MASVIREIVYYGKEHLMSISSYMIAVDCDNAAALAQFWSAVLGEPVAAGSSEEFARSNPAPPALA